MVTARQIQVGSGGQLGNWRPGEPLTVRLSLVCPFGSYFQGDPPTRVLFSLRKPQVVGWVWAPLKTPTPQIFYLNSAGLHLA